MRIPQSSKKITDLYYEGYTPKEIAKILGYKTSGACTVKRRLVKLGVVENKFEKKQYAVYDLKDNEVCVNIGSAEELAILYDVKTAYIYEIVRKKYLFKHRYIMEKL